MVPRSRQVMERLGCVAPFAMVVRRAVRRRV